MRRPLVPLALVVLAGCGGSDSGEAPAGATGAAVCALDAPALVTGRLTTDGTRLRDELGRVVILRGVAAGGRSKFAPFVPFDFAGDSDFEPALDRYFDQLASWGIDVVRLPFSWEAEEPEQGQPDDAYHARYGRLVDAAWKRGIRVLVDFHQDVYASPFGGDGFPLWTLGSIPHGAPRHDYPSWFFQYGKPGSPVIAAFERFWKNEDGIQDAFEAMWERMAERHAKRPGVIGIEPINEPGWGEAGQHDMEQRLLVPLVERIGAAVRKHAPDALIFQGGPGQNALDGTSAAPDTSLAGFVWAPHRYDPGVSLGADYTNVDADREALDTLAAVGTDRGHPAFFGEFGAPNRSPGQLAFLRDAYAELDRLQVHATLWEASRSAELWNAEDLGILGADGTEKPAVDAVVRGYPRAIDGTLDAFSWDPIAHALDVKVSSAGPGVSEVYVPPRHVGASPHVTLDGGCHAWNPASGRLLVRAAGASWTLHVAP